MSGGLVPGVGARRAGAGGGESTPRPGGVWEASQMHSTHSSHGPYLPGGPSTPAPPSGTPQAWTPGQPLASLTVVAPNSHSLIPRDQREQGLFPAPIFLVSFELEGKEVTHHHL